MSVPDFLLTARPEDQWKQDDTIVQSKQHLEEMLHDLLNAPTWAKTGQRVISNDTETTGLSPVNPDHHIVGISFSTPTKDWYIPLRHNTPEPQLNAERVIKIIDEVIFGNQDILLVGHNYGKFDYNMFRKEGVKNLEPRFKTQGIFDTEPMYWLLDENQKDDEAYYLIQPGQKAKFISYKSPFKTSPEYKNLRIPVLEHFSIAAVQMLDGYSLKALSNKILGIPMLEFFDAVVKKHKVAYRDIAMHIGGNYAKHDTYCNIRLFQYGADQLYTEKLENAFWKVEMPFMKVAANMERRGIPVAKNKISELRDICQDGMVRATKTLYEMVGHEFNINSGPQMAKVYEELDVIHLVPKTEKGNYKADEETIEMLATKTKNPALMQIVRFKKYKKMIGTYIDGDSGLYTRIDVDGRAHPSILQTSTVTGRNSIIGPPCQTWPANPIEQVDLDYDTIMAMVEAGENLEERFPWTVHYGIDEDGNKYAYMAVHLRDCISEEETRPGYKIFASDFAQMELRMLCHYAKDQKMLDAFYSGMDFHTTNAVNTFGVDYDHVTKEMRRQAKAVSFGLAYGKTKQGFAEDFFGDQPDFYTGKVTKWGHEITKKYLDRAQQIIDTFFGAYEDTAAWIVSVHKYVETYGFIRTITGRKRRLPEIWSDEGGKQNRARRQAVNTKIQGSSADWIKMAMIKLDEALEGTGIELLLPVHDELVGAVPPGKDEEAIELVKFHMENVLPAPLFCPMVADPATALRYGAAK